MQVYMDCPGCEAKVKKALQKLHGVDSVDIDMGKQKVTVTGVVDQRKVLKTVRGTGRTAVLWPYPYNPEYHDFTRRYYFKHQSYPATHHATVASSPYNYDIHGYNGHEHGYYQKPPYTALIDEKVSSMFSDDNTNSSCSIM
ncbi:heavy metal-associated isoprenylated plant protein 29-like [Impatiens glandulifera]|uniref:heavy metal-associated isoprenylated plant protein 29-like n=1 Tax=Impatiens glandulifera TaxID=253017 RepID=UPI001FB10EC3|nr:heavy metal-associated isoprenylated plant protein 29-like [Impatiens glandulifera]